MAHILVGNMAQWIVPRAHNTIITINYKFPHFTDPHLYLWLSFDEYNNQYGHDFRLDHKIYNYRPSSSAVKPEPNKTCFYNGQVIQIDLKLSFFDLPNGVSSPAGQIR